MTIARTDILNDSRSRMLAHQNTALELLKDNTADHIMIDREIISRFYAAFGNAAYELGNCIKDTVEQERIDRFLAKND